MTTEPLTEKELAIVEFGFPAPEHPVNRLIKDLRAARAALRDLIDRVDKNPQLGEGREYPEMAKARAALPPED